VKALQHCGAPITYERESGVLWVFAADVSIRDRRAQEIIQYEQAMGVSDSSRS
jgi:hypothetical protein